MRKRMLLISNSVQAIGALGGTRDVAALFNPPLNYRVVHNWLDPKRGLPPHSYHVLAPALIQKGFSFHPFLFGQLLPRERRRRRPRQGDQPSTEQRSQHG